MDRQMPSADKSSHGLKNAKLVYYYLLYLFSTEVSVIKYMIRFITDEGSVYLL